MLSDSDGVYYTLIAPCLLKPRIIARSMRMFAWTELLRKPIRLRQTAEATNRRRKENVAVALLMYTKVKKCRQL